MTYATLPFSVVICTYTDERWTDLVDAIESVYAQRTPAHEVIVVVDHNELLRERVRARFPQITVIPNTEQRGLSGARNSGLAAASGGIIAFLDDDAIAAPDWLAHLQAAYADHNVVSVGGAIVPEWPTGRPAWFPAEFDWVVGCTYTGMPTTTTPVRNLIGANISFRRELFAAVGGFRHGIGRIGKRPLGGEETELCIRARQHWPHALFIYEPRARVNHRIALSRTRWRYFRARCYAEGVSKAMLTQFVGQNDALASERTYTMRTLPRGVIRNSVAAVQTHDWGKLARAGAIIAGLAITTTGYAAGRMVQWQAARRAAQAARLERHATPTPQEG